MGTLLVRYEAPWSFSAEGFTHPIFSTGKGPDVVLLHELPGLVDSCLELGLILGERFRVHLPVLFDQAGGPSTLCRSARNTWRICISKEIHAFAAHRTSPVVSWLRALCRTLKDRSGHAGVGVIGMCITGNFALALVAEESVLAPVVAQPGLPARKTGLALSPPDAEVVRRRAAQLGEGCVLGLRYDRDWVCPPSTFRMIRELIGNGFRPVELPGSHHATLTLHLNATALRETIDFLSARLLAPSPRRA
jgi:dienelactone hydrolase